MKPSNILFEDVPIVIGQAPTNEGLPQRVLLLNLGPAHALLPIVMIATENDRGEAHFLSLQEEPRLVAPGEEVDLLSADLLEAAMNSEDGSGSMAAYLMGTSNGQKTALFAEVVTQFNDSTRRAYRVQLYDLSSDRAGYRGSSTYPYVTRNAEKVKPGTYSIG